VADPPNVAVVALVGFKFVEGLVASVEGQATGLADAPKGMPRFGGRSSSISFPDGDHHDTLRDGRSVVGNPQRPAEGSDNRVHEGDVVGVEVKRRVCSGVGDQRHPKIAVTLTCSPSRLTAARRSPILAAGARSRSSVFRIGVDRRSGREADEGGLRFGFPSRHAQDRS
jgi:hypothetical protein